MTKGAVDFEFGDGFELESRPAAHGVESFERGRGIVEVAGGEDGLIDAAAEATDAAAAIELTAEFEVAAKRNGEVGSPGPAIHVAAEAPVLTFVIATESGGKFLAKECMRPSDAGSVSGLAGFFSSGGLAVPRIAGIFAGQRIEDAALQSEFRSFGKLHAMFNAHLRSPGPKVSGVGEGRDGDSGQGSRSQRREKEMILAGDQGCVFPVETHGTSSQTNDASGDAVGAIGETSREIEIDVCAGVGAGDFRAESLQADLRLPEGGAESTRRVFWFALESRPGKSRLFTTPRLEKVLNNTMPERRTLYFEALSTLVWYWSLTLPSMRP